MNTTDKLSFFAIGISIFVAIFSWYSFSKTDELARNGFNRNYRPYIFAANFASINPIDNKYYNEVATLMIRVYNAPTFVTKETLNFYLRENNVDTLILNQPVSNNKIYYPLDNIQITIGTDKSIINDSTALTILPKRLIRKYRVEYQWLSDSSLKYFFESEWEYNLENKNWSILSQNAN